MATSCARRRTLPFLPLLVSGVSGAGGSQRKPLLANYRGAPVWHAIELLSAAKLRGEIRGLNTQSQAVFFSTFLSSSLNITLFGDLLFFVDKKSFKTV